MDKKVVIAFIPVLHRGYLDFLKGGGVHEVFILEASDVPELPRFSRELRALRYEELKGLLAVYGFTVLRFSEYHESIRVNAEEVLMPDEDISRAVYEKYLQGVPVSFARTFLRWDWKRSTEVTVSVIPEADRVIKKDDSGHGFVVSRMEALLQEGERSSDWWRQVGGMVVTPSQTLVAHNAHFPHEYAPYFDGDPRNNFGPGEYIEVSTALHAERGLIAEAARRGVALQGAELYVTTFPCGDCASQIAVAGICRVYFTGGYSNLNGVETLRTHGVELIYVEL